MGQQELYREILERKRDGKSVSDKARLAVDELMDIDSKIDGHKAELNKIQTHVSWLKAQIETLEKQKQDILDGFPDKRKV